MPNLLFEAAGCIKNGRELMGSKWRNCEAECIAVQTICACATNLEKRGEAISWQGKGLLEGRAACGTDNAGGLGLLVADGMLISEEYKGELKPSKPEDIAQRDGKFIVLRCTDKLLHYTIGHVAR